MFLFDYFSGLATNVSVQLLVASMGSINTENMVSATDLINYRFLTTETIVIGSKRFFSEGI